MTDGVTDTIGRVVEDAGSAGAGSGPPSPPTPAATPPPRPPVHRRRWFLPVLVLSLLVVIGGALALVGLVGGAGDGDGDGLHRALDDALLGERYDADLTQGRGDFTVVSDESSASSYESDGFHLVAKDRVPAIRGIQANGSHSSLGVRISTMSVTSTGDFAFGPFCFHTPEEGFGLMISNDGSALLVERATSGGAAFRVVRSTPIDPIDWSQWHTLRLDCSVNGALGAHGKVALRGYVDGDVVVRGTARGRADVFAYTGFGGVNDAPAPAEWVVRSFSRLGADDVGRNP